jgi:hypothetical protein
MPVRIIPHEESFEVVYPGRGSVWFYFDDNPSRRAISGRATREQAEANAKTFARGARLELKGKK